jgi:hypothetical protein
MAGDVPAANSARGEAGMVTTCKSEMTAGMSAAEMAAASARQRERRNEDGTGKRRRNGGTPNGISHGISPCACVGRARPEFGSN